MSRIAESPISLIASKSFRKNIIDEIFDLEEKQAVVYSSLRPNL
jgi:hypothetical protein